MCFGSAALGWLSPYVHTLIWLPRANTGQNCEPWKREAQHVEHCDCRVKIHFENEKKLELYQTCIVTLASNIYESLSPALLSPWLFLLSSRMSSDVSWLLLRLLHASNETAFWGIKKVFSGSKNGGGAWEKCLQLSKIDKPTIHTNLTGVLNAWNGGRVCYHISTVTLTSFHLPCDIRNGEKVYLVSLLNMRICCAIAVFTFFHLLC